jgi:glutathione synthase/RimK-type ligase-like ATP-grasp enzyme
MSKRETNNNQRRKLKIAVGEDSLSWHIKFSSALEKRIDQGKLICYDIVNLENHDWIDKILGYDIVIWKPSYMGPEQAALFKEKIYFIENYMNITVVPNFSTIWHFESKIAQSYLMKLFNIACPKTFVSFNYHDALNNINEFAKPIVFKRYFGAASKNVWLEDKYYKIINIFYKNYCRQYWSDAKKKSRFKIVQIVSNLNKLWFWETVKQKLLGNQMKPSVVYLQEFIPDNKGDLRITIIGTKYGFGFWRSNRPGDFRASGSGLIDYHKEIPETTLRECFHINNILNFDSMSYDILFKGDQSLITEMSYGYLDSAIYNCAVFYEMDDDGTLKVREGNVWPQDLWVEWALYKAGINKEREILL